MRNIFNKNLFFDALLLIIITILSSIVIFLINLYILKPQYNFEEEYIDRSFSLESSKEDLVKWISQTKKDIITKTDIENKYVFKYIPEEFEYEVVAEKYYLEKTLSSKIFIKYIKKLILELYKIKEEVRWKMTESKIKLFGILEIDNPELISVFIHELAHYIDIYYFDKSLWKDSDISNKFYDISWNSTKVIKSWQDTKDFVSWYSMTNKYEDFAESFNYFVFHNKDFLKKSEKSQILKNKYDFFLENIFINNEFKNIDFWFWYEIKDYYRDVTKIEINLENFLQYLENNI